MSRLKILVPLLAAILLLQSCGQNSKQPNTEGDSNRVTKGKDTVVQNTKDSIHSDTTESTKPIDAKNEIKKWKKELLDRRLLGGPCNFNSTQDPDAIKWQNRYPERQDGLPSNDKEIKHIYADFDNDGRQDLYMHFMSQNCSGHNGGTPSFGKIVYADGTSNSNLRQEIISAILTEYNKMRKTVKGLKAVTRNYIEERLTFDNADQVKGKFTLYGTDDAHCCPSYNGNYIYKPHNKSIVIEVLKAK